MKIIKILLLAFILIFTLSGLASAIELVSDKARSKIAFSVGHFLFSTTDGRFKDFQGSIELDEQNLVRSTVDFTIRVASIDTDNKKRDTHLRTADFFDAEKFPDARFVSTSIEKVSGGGFRLDGNLTIHGVTKKVAFRLDYLGEKKGPDGLLNARFKASTVLDRRDFGITYDPTGFGIGKKVTLDVDAVMVPPMSHP